MENTNQNPGKVPNKNSFLIQGLFTVMVIFGIIAAIYFSNVSTINNSNNHPAASQQTITPEESRQLIQGTIVHIVCPVADGSDTYLGSGTIISNGGLIVTNAHVIPHDKTYLNTLSEGCLVYLPDPKTGMIMLGKAYKAQPKIIKDIGDKYDLATLQIYDVAGNNVTEKISTLPSVFPSFDITKGCSLKDINLGDKIHIYGYPDTGGNDLSLTLTDGIVSSFPGDGYILTDAKINHGNSGGLAINDKGCFIGIPEAVYQGDLASYGYIISKDLIDQYFVASKTNNPALKPESEETRLISRTKIEQYYGGAPYFMAFSDLSNDSGKYGKMRAGSSDIISVETTGDDDKNLVFAFISAKVNINDQSSLSKSVYAFNNFINLIDNRILANDENFIINMLSQITSEPVRNINGLTISISYNEKLSSVLMVISRTTDNNSSAIGETNSVSNLQVSNSTNDYTAPQPVPSTAFISLTSSGDQKPDTRGFFHLRGTTSDNCNKISVKLVNTDVGLADYYELKLYKPGDTTFVYSMKPELHNIGLGDNKYTFTAYCEGNQVVETSTDFIFSMH